MSDEPRMVDEVQRRYDAWASKGLGDFDARLMEWLIANRPDAVDAVLDWFERRNFGFCSRSGHCRRCSTRRST